MRLPIIMFAVALLLVACNGQSTQKENSMKKNEPVTEENNSDLVEQEDEQIPETNVEEEKEDKKVEAPEVEVVAPEYKMNAVFALEPVKDANPKVVLLTIDDAPDKYALEMAKTLKELHAPAIFFVNGHFINSPEKEAILKKIYDLGFEIGNHTFSHANLTTLSPEEQKEEILSVNDKVEEITGERPKFFRAPFGANTDVSKQIATEENMLVMNWTYGYDWEKDYMSKDAIADIMVNTELLGNGANLLMHDREWTNGGLKQIVKGLRDKGFETLDPKLIETPQ
ncbi:polysaccharide deacetylase family protein [Bacillus sp. FJAT-49732]|uniref:Polysaccharide deacetylase family protein n=1 Tax=Lederbergia citrisecunda TaxID=2833583 RepID=A0A942TKH2_9BACI|nr:polysaccharide deacetylase family protein [Lederbergia citrisecunda]MBS4198808.1 polysaccharide deacetylase family protein [Lederbergia citrisecunda]